MPPSPSQTASPLSLILFNFLNRTIWRAYQMQHLPLSELPPLADSDHSKHLTRIAFPHIDPYYDLRSVSMPHGVIPHPSQPHRSILRAVIFIFQKEIIIISFLLLLNTAMTLVSPYGLKRLLEFMGDGGEGETIKPFVWIALVRSPDLF